MRQIGLEPDLILAPDIDETPRKAEKPRLYAARMAAEKLGQIDSPGFVIAADTVVAAGARILPKAESLAEAERCLRLLSGRRHDVLTSVAIRAPDGRTVQKTVASVAGFSRLDGQRIKSYLATEEWRGKAGGYAIQGQAAAFIDFISGSYSGVVGLPLYETSNLLRGLGYQFP